HQAEKKTIDRPNLEERRHTSLPAPGEWTQSYAQWSRNYQNFIAALKEVYCFQIFSEWFRIHRDRCDQLMRREGFCAGFRYDLAQRQDETKKSVSLITLTFLAEGRTTSTLTLALKKPTTAATDTATQGPEVATVLNNDPDKTSTKTITEHQETTAIPTNRQGSREEKITEVNIKREDMGTKTDQEAEPAVINPHRDRDRTRQEVGSVLSRSLPVHPTTPPLFKLPTAILHV
ncbi:hypothetical protein PSTG_18269, partial [Puccinia striiformis f. sp. tritici PST-78]